MSVKTSGRKPYGCKQYYGKWVLVTVSTFQIILTKCYSKQLKMFKHGKNLQIAKPGKYKQEWGGPKTIWVLYRVQCISMSLTVLEIMFLSKTKLVCCNAQASTTRHEMGIKHTHDVIWFLYLVSNQRFCNYKFRGCLCVRPRFLLARYLKNEWLNVWRIYMEVSS